jgi:hypothetical protein
MKLTRKQAWPVVGKVFPDYKGRKFKLVFKEEITLYDTNWSGGTRNEYAAVRADGMTGTFHAPAPWANPGEGRTVPVNPGVLILCHSYFCGQDMGITIYAHPSHQPKWLEASYGRP